MLFKENKIIIRGDLPQQLKFTSSDSEDLFEKNKNHPKMLSKYLNPNNPLIYSYNSMGYRTKEFSSFRENEFILVMGCSYTEGIGLHEQDIWHSHISQEFNLPIMNLGIGGTGADIVFLNTLQYIKNNYPKPKMVIAQWSGEYRKYFVHQKNWIWSHVPSIDHNLVNEEARQDMHWYHNRYVTYDGQQKHDNYKNIMSTKLLWESQGIPYLGWGWHDDQPNSDGYLKLVRTKELDKARDMAHPGPSVQYEVYKQIVEDVRKCLNG